jgi:hypothetical protein
VRRRDLHGAGAERRVDLLVGHDRDAPVRQRQGDLLADQVPIARVVGVHGHGGVAEHRLGPRGRHHDRLVTVAVADRDQLPVVLGVVDLDVGKRRQAARAPVDDPLGAVDQIVVVELLEDRADCHGQALVHREPLAGPVHAVAEAAHLPEDLAAVLLLPGPHLGDELLAGVVVLALALGLGEMPFDQGLRGDASVIHAGQPQRLEALHPLATDDHVHERVAERVPDVQAACDIRRRQHYREAGLCAVDVGGEVATLDPALVQRSLDRRRVVLGGQRCLAHACMVRTRR